MRLGLRRVLGSRLLWWWLLLLCLRLRLPLLRMLSLCGRRQQEGKVRKLNVDAN